MQESGSPEVTPFTCTPALWGQSPELQGAPRRESSLQPGGCQVAGIALLPQCPQDSEIHFWRAWSLMTVASVFTEMAGNTHFLTPSLSCMCVWRVRLPAQPGAGNRLEKVRNASERTG